MKSLSESIKILSYTGMLLSALLLMTPAYACVDGTPCMDGLPTGFTVESGTATVDTSTPGTLAITSSDGAILSFLDFSIAVDRTVSFILPTSDAMVLARSTGGAVSDIFGSLLSNGRVFLVNSNGINIGQSANIQTHDFVASTLDIQNAMFAAGQFDFNQVAGKNGSITNDGNIEVSDGGNVALIAQQVTNNGTIQANLGHVVLGSAKSATLSFDSEGLISLAITEPLAQRISNQTPVINTGSIHATGGRVTLKAEELNEALDASINNTGVIEASQAVEHDGIIELVSETGAVSSTGSLTASQVAIRGSSVEVAGNIASNLGAVVVSKNDINVTADLSVEGDLTLEADSDKDGEGSIFQTLNTTITTSGDLTLKASGTSELSNLSVGGLLSYLAQTPGALYKEASGSTISAESLLIGANVTLDSVIAIPSDPSLRGAPGAEAISQSTLFSLIKDWTNEGTFLPGTSKVELTSTEDSTISGDNTFHDFYVLAPEKTVKFQSGSTQNFEGTLSLQGSYGKLLNIKSTQEGISWNIGQVNNYEIKFASLQDTIYVYAHGPPVSVNLTQNLLGNSGFNFAPLIFLGTEDNLFSNPNNWNTGVLPNSGDSVSLRGASSAEAISQRDEILIDPSFNNTILSLTLDPTFTGSLTLQNTLKIRQDLKVLSGTFNASNQTVEFVDGTEKSHLEGDITFYGFRVNAPDKVIIFEAGKTFSFLGPVYVKGEKPYDLKNHYVKFYSSNPGSSYTLDFNNPAITDPRIFLERVEFQDATSAHSLYVDIGKNSGRNTNIKVDPLWTGAVDGTWSTGNNWDTLSAPGNAEDATFNTANLLGAAVTTINVDFTGFAVTLATVTVGNGFTLNMNCDAAMQTLVIQNGGTFNGGTNRTVVITTSLSNSGTFNRETGTFEFQGASLTLPNVQFYNLTVRNNASLTMSQALALGGFLDIQAGSTLNTSGSNYQLTVSGDWSNAGTFTPNSGTVILNSAGARTISGNTTFYDLTLNVSGSSAGTVFANGTTQTITHTFTSVANLTNSGGVWSIDPQGARVLTSGITVTGSTNTNAIEMLCNGCTDGGSNTNWFFPNGTATVTWTGGGGDSNWNTKANWDSGHVPNWSGATLVFDSAVNNASINSNFSIAALTITANYTGTISMSTNMTLTIAGAYTQSGGTFTMDNAGATTLAVGGNMTLTGGNATNGASGNGGAAAPVSNGSDGAAGTAGTSVTFNQNNNTVNVTGGISLTGGSGGSGGSGGNGASSPNTTSAGGNGGNGGSGADGGSVTFNSAGTLTAASIVLTGANAGSPGSPGSSAAGSAGDFGTDATCCYVNGSNGNASGQPGGNGGNAGHAGAGGSVTLSKTAGTLTVSGTVSLTAGSSSNGTSGAAGTAGVNGGNGGATVGGANGGTGQASGSSGNGGNGGNGAAGGGVTSFL